MQVAVCVITYRRPVGLRRLLDALSRLTFAGQGPDVCCQVVDNDAEGTSRGVVDEARPGFRWPLRYAVEPRRGIPFARNTAMREVLPQADWIAFIDDDEVPEPGWLHELLRVGAEHGADVVAGPVEPCFESPAPDWIVRGGFFWPRAHQTGFRLDRAATGNVLFRAAILQAVSPWFDERMALTGGTDIHFFRRAHRAGFRIVWARDAVVTERVPESRMHAPWIWRRAFRYGASTSRIELDLHGVLIGASLVVASGGYKLLKGALFVLPSAGARGRAGWVKYVRLMHFGAGMLYGLVGGRYEEYRTVHGG